jgi:PAS domain-containing protein
MPELKAFLAGGGEMGARIRERDWSGTPLGPISGWPQSLRSALGISLRTPTASAVFWGPDHLFLYNDPWAALLRDGRHPGMLGRPAREVLEDVWDVLGEQFARVLADGQAVNMVDTLLVRHLQGQVYDSYWSYSLLPVAGEDGQIAGILAQVRESTQFVQRARRDALMLRVSEMLRRLDDPADILDTAFALVGEEVHASRIGYAEIDEAGGSVEILRCAVENGAADISGIFPIPQFGAGIDEDLRAGETIRIHDAAADPRLADPEVAARYEKLGVASALVVPIVSGDRCLAMLFAHHDSPRSWSDHEATLLRQATAHVWREISRARAELALRRSEERFRRIFEQANDLIVTATLDQGLPGLRRSPPPTPVPGSKRRRC